MLSSTQFKGLSFFRIPVLWTFLDAGVSVSFCKIDAENEWKKVDALLYKFF